MSTAVIDPKVIGKRIRDLRMQKNISRKQMLEETGITYSALSNYENGIRVPRDEAKVKIADCLKVTVQFLFFD